MDYQLIGGRCEHALKNLPDNSVDSIVTDPPYGIGFMSNKWDYSSPADMAERGFVYAHNRLFTALAAKRWEMKQSSGVMA
ncbi:hypothetical protein [Morganella morganii]|uniref:hypothetical protein n=1 Tax=Morganella morganii TaxID=582 RepID=UPI001FFC2ECD|nr:hypothetical protein [Morganella morganii]